MNFQNILDSFQQLLTEQKINWRLIRGGVAIEFSDQCDAIFVTEETISGYLDENGDSTEPSSMAQLVLAKYQSLDKARSQVLMAIRHLAAESKMALEFSTSGDWGITASYCESSIEVGSSVTHLLEKMDAATALQELLKNSMLGTPSKIKAEKLLSMTELPEKEESLSGLEAESPFDPLLFLYLDCSVLGKKELEQLSPFQIAKNLFRNRKSPGLTVIRQLREELSEDCFSIDICSRGSVVFDYSDNLDSLRIVPLGQKISQLIERVGVEAAVEYFVSDYQKMDATRSAALKCLKSIIAQHDYYLDLYAFDQKWHFGKTYRQFSFDPGKSLSRKLKKQTPAEVVSSWITENSPFECPSLAELNQLIDAPPEAPIERNLLANKFSSSPILPALKDLNYTELDALASRFIEEVKQHSQLSGNKRRLFGQDPLWWWENPLWYQRGKDTWVDESWWIDVAEKAWKDEKHYGAATILIANGDLECRTELLANYMKLDFYHHEAIDDTLFWLLRKELSFELVDEEAPDYPEILGSPPPQRSRRLARSIQEEIRNAMSGGEFEMTPEEHFDDALSFLRHLDECSASEWLEEWEISLLQDQCKAWASTPLGEHGLLSTSPLDIARRFDWFEIAELLTSNPTFIPALLQSDYDQTFVGTIAQQLSMISQGPLAVRLAAHAMTINVDTCAKLAAEELAKIPGNQGAQVAFQDTFKTQLQMTQLQGAIAWTRCRQDIAS